MIFFGSAEAAAGSKRAFGENAPLAARFRPESLEEYVGQSHLLVAGKPLRRLIESDRLTSLILFGPPGVGKTSLAEVIARRTECHFERLNGVESSVADLRRVLAAAVTRLKASGRRTVLFIDEIHRFNKAQQDVLLPDVEAGSVRLIGATTHNPSFYINGPLVSRSQIFQTGAAEQGGAVGVDRPGAERCGAGAGAAEGGADGGGAGAFDCDFGGGCAAGAQWAGGGGADDAGGRGWDGDGGYAGDRGVCAEEAGALRPGRGSALRHDLGIHQVGAGERSGLGALLAGEGWWRRARIRGSSRGGW